MKKPVLLFALFTMMGQLSHDHVSLLQFRNSVARASDGKSVGFQAKPIMENDGKTTVRGELLKAFQTAHAAFLRSPEFPKARKRIENYDVQFTEDADNLIVLFVPRRMPNEPRLPGGGTKLGHAARFVISKDNYRLIEMKFYR